MICRCDICEKQFDTDVEVGKEVDGVVYCETCAVNAGLVNYEASDEAISSLLNESSNEALYVGKLSNISQLSEVIEAAHSIGIETLAELNRFLSDNKQGNESDLDTLNRYIAELSAISVDEDLDDDGLEPDPEHYKDFNEGDDPLYGYGEDDNKVSMLSIDAQSFLSKDINYQFTERIKKFESELEIAPSTQLLDSQSLKQFILDNMSIYIKEYEVEDNEYTGVIDNSTDYDVSIESIDYQNTGGDLRLYVNLKLAAEITLYGTEHDTDWYNPPYYDEEEKTYVAYPLLNILIPADPADFDSYEFDDVDVDDFDWQEE